MTVEHLTALVLAVGGVPAVIKLLDWFKAIRSGRAREEKQRNRLALSQLEEEMTFRRRLQEHISVLRRLLIDMGFPEDKLPTLPVRTYRSYHR